MSQNYAPPSEAQVARMSAAFDAISDPADWRNPIDAVVENDVVELTVEAVIFYTACVPQVDPVDDDHSRIQAVGYRAGPAGP